MRRHLLFAPLLALVLLAAGCGSDGDGEVEGTITAADIQEDQASGPGSFTIVVGERTWSFESVQCAFGEEQIGQEGAEFVLSAIEDGVQAYVSIDGFGTSVTLDDIEDFDDPSVSYSAFGDSVAVDIADKNISGIGDFLDGTADGLESVEGTFAGTCP